MDLPELPIRPALPEIAARLQTGHLVLGAPPGSGKTTLVPLALRDAEWLAGRKIVMLEPRRPAARMAARRMAQLLGECVGETVGYQVRFERRTGPATRIEVLTEGLLLRRLQQDPELGDTGLVIFDEFHERSLQTDLSLALCLDAASGLRKDLRLLLMSASLDGQALADGLGASHLEAEGRSHPVAVHYLECDPPARELEGILARLVRQALREQEGDLLVFLPGRGEIARLADALADLEAQGIGVQALHGELPASEQDAVIRGGQGRRVILATDLAETSLTLEGIQVVIDSGLNRRPRFDPASGLTRLHTGFISRASALQRAGRAGRQAPGACYRAWSEARQARLEPDIRPEILEADLAPAVLELANWGVRDPHQLSWVTPPPEAHWAQASTLLRQLEAIDPQGRITPAGRDMAKLPLPPRLAHMLLGAGAECREATDIAALLSERDPLRRRQGEAMPCDLRPRLDALACWRATSEPPPDCDRGALVRIDQVARQLRSLLPNTDTPSSGAASMSPGRLLLAAFPDRVALARKPGSHRYLLRSGRAASLPLHDGLRGERLLVVAALDAGEREGRIWLAAPLREKELEEALGAQIRETRELRWDQSLQGVTARRMRRLDALLLDERSEPLSLEDDPLPLLLQQIRLRGLDLFDGAPALRGLQGQLTLLRRHLSELDWPDASDAALLDTLETWLAPWLEGVTSLRRLQSIDVVEALRAWLGWERMQRLQALLPEHYETPAGTWRRIDYPADGDPVLRVPLQEVLGLKETPCIAEGRIPLTLHLLSPAMRPLQITRDLGHFWANGYAEVRKEMRGRYPKHSWPEDPASATACRLGRRGG